MRIIISKEFKLEKQYWWLTWAGGLLVSLIGISSIYKTLTGKGWSWKGRPLANIKSKTRGTVN